MIVLDASAVVDVVTDQPTADWVLTQLRGTQVCAPAHQPAEVLSALARPARAEVLTRADARDAALEAASLQQELVVPSARHLSRTLELADRVRVLDGLYVALAEQRELALVTTDERLGRAQLPVDVRTPTSSRDT